MSNARPLPMLLAVLAATVVAATALAETPQPVAPSPPPAPIVRRGAALPTYPIAKGLGSATIFYDAASGSPDAALTLLVLRPGAAVPAHVHADSVEMLYVLEGRAEMRVGAETIAIGPGDAARIPKGVEHEATVVGDVPLRAVQIYTPAGPEQRFVPKP